MGYNFPASPAVGTLYPVSPPPGLPQYRWDGVAWVGQLNATDSFVKKSGDTMASAAAAPTLDVGNTNTNVQSSGTMGFATIKANANAGNYISTGVNAVRPKVRPSIAGMGSWPTPGTDVTFMIPGIYGWVPPGGHGNSAQAALFDRGADGVGNTPGQAYSVVIAGGVNGLTGFALAVYDWTLGTYTFTLYGDGTASGKTPAAGDNSTKFATTAFAHPRDAQLFSNIPMNNVVAPYTCVATDAGKCIKANGGTVTIPSNASVPYPIGTAISFAAWGGAITITCAETMYLAGTATVGSRTLSNTGIATAIKTSTTEWAISGAGLT